MSNRNANDETVGAGAHRTDPPSVTDPRVSEKTRSSSGKPAGVVTWAWRTVFALITVTLLIAIFAGIQPLPPPVDPKPAPRTQTSRQPDRVPPSPCELEQRAVRQWRAFRERLLHERLHRTERAIRDGIDVAFAPVYTRIPEFLDWHYSVIGQYMELGQAAVGQLQQALEARLFADLQERIDVTSADVGLVMQDEMRTLVDQWVRNEGQMLPTEALRRTYKDMLEATIPNTVRRFTWTAGPSVVVAAGAGAGGAAAATMFGKALAQKLTASVALKTASKAVVKVGSPLGAAAAGATAGSVLGPAGAAIGGIVAGAAAWLLFDSAAVNIDEHLNRSALEQDLTELVDESKAQIQTGLLDAVEQARSEALAELGPAQAGACSDDGNDADPGPLDPVPPSELPNRD